MVAQELNRLPDDWIIINDILIERNEQFAQIDHLVVTPSFVVCIETKHWKTAKTDIHGNWYKYHNRRWHLVKRSPFDQVYDHAKVFKKFYTGTIQN